MKTTRVTRMHRKRRRPTGLPAGARSVVGWIDLVRAGRRPYRSSVERDGLIRLDLDHGVASMERNDLSERFVGQWIAVAPGGTVEAVAPTADDLRNELRRRRLVGAVLPIGIVRLALRIRGLRGNDGHQDGGDDGSAHDSRTPGLRRHL